MVNYPDVVQAMVKTGIPDAEIISRGTTFLSNRKAFFVKAKGTYRSLDQESELIFYQVAVLFEGTTYYLTCRAPNDNFEKYFPEFKDIIKGFVLRPTKITVR